MLATTGCGKAPITALEHSLTITVIGEGAVTPVSGNNYDKGTLVELIPTASPGWVFDTWDGPDGTSVVIEAGKHKIAMDKNITVEAI